MAKFSTLTAIPLGRGRCAMIKKPSGPFPLRAIHQEGGDESDTMKAAMAAIEKATGN